MIEAKILITLGKCVMISKPLWIQSYLYQVLYFVVVLKQEGKGQEQPLKEWYDHAAAKSLQSCPTLCDPRDGSPAGSPVPGILQARTLEWVAISFSNAWKWKVKVKSLSRVWPSATPWTAAYHAAPSMGFSRQEYWSGAPHRTWQKLVRTNYVQDGWIFCFQCVLILIVICSL